MRHCVAILEDAGPERAVGVWFPDLPGCFSAGDDRDEALRNAPEAVTLHARPLARECRPLPVARSSAELRTDPDLAEDLRGHIVAPVSLLALVSLPALISLPAPADAAQ
jgi:predicted RNase H-like HicB family nuclease